MLFITQHNLRGLLCIILLLSSFSIFAQFSLKVDRTKANYSIGETAEFILISPQSGTATYKLKYDNITPVISTGNISVQANVPTTIPFQGTSAEVILCEINLNGASKTAAAVFDSENIALFSDEPADFDQFWDNQKNLSAAIPLDPQLTYLSNDADVTNYRINLANIENRRVYGYISVPNSGSNFPAIITLPPYSTDANTANPQSFIANRAKVLSVTISVHNVEPDQIDPLSYEPNIINDPNSYYYRYAILGTLRMIDYLYTRSDFDGQNVGVTGVSQGGGLALIAAGLDERIKSLSISNPAMCRHAGYDQSKASGFPYYVQRSDFLVNNTTHYAQTLSASRYYEGAYFARRYMGPTLAVVSYADDITPAGSSFAAINELRGKKIIVHARDLAHAHPTEYWDGRYNLWRHEFPTTVNPPYHINTGYWPEAGDDRATTTNTALDLNGQIFQNGINNYDFPVEWDVISAPGNVSFNNKNIANPTVQFDTPGSYLLRYTTYDYGTLMDGGIFHEISDFISIQVEEEEDTQVSDTTLPNCQLTFTGFNADGSLQISVDFSETIVGLTADDFSITNGTVTSLNGSGTNYFLNILPIAVGNVRISLPYGQTTDIAGNSNLPSNQVSIYVSNPPNNPGDTCENVTSGGEINGDESACEAFDANVVGNSSLPTGGSGNLEYQWQSASSLAGNWTNIQNANSATFDPSFLSTTTYFRRLSRRTNCDDFAGISNAIVKEIVEEETPAPNAPIGYCTMQGDNPSNVWIRRIELENLSNESAQEGYGDFTSESATLAPGGLYMVRLTPGNETVMNNWVGWIDYNRDGDFNDDRELIIFKNDNSAVNAFFEVPANAEEGATRMRIALRGDNFAAPCYSYTEGEVEDYTIILGSEAGGGGTTTNDPTPTGPAPTYCTVKGTEPWWQWISQVQFADLDNSSFKEQYGRFTDRFANVDAGSTYEITLTPDFSWLVYDMNWKVWIDFNQDGDFEDTGELVVNGNSDSSMSFDVQIPSSAPAGTTGMRVAMDINEISDACTNVVRGEFEDYSVVINSGGCNNMGNNRFSPILDLTAQPYAREVELHWTTNTEYKNQNFILEHSVDGINFEELEEQESLTDGYLPNVYRTKHEFPPLGENIYRVKQIYNSGSHKYSDEKKVFFNLDLEAFTLYPNPSSQKLYLPLQKYAGQTAHVKIYNTFAQLLSTFDVNSLSIEPEEIDVSDLQDGIYYISIEIAGQRTISQAFTVFRI